MIDSNTTTLKPSAEKQMQTLQEELKEVKEDLAAAEEQRLKALDELQEMKKVAEAANARLSETLAAQAQVQHSSRIDEFEQASIESAKKRDQAWQIELEAVQKQHTLDVEALSSVSRELDRVRLELISVKEEKEAAVKEAAEAKNISEVNAKMVVALSSELKYVKESLNDSNAELEARQKKMDSVMLVLERAKSTEVELAEKTTSLEKLQNKQHTTESEHKAVDSSSESTGGVQMFEKEVEKGKESEELEKTKVLLKEAKEEITALQNKIQSLEDSVSASKKDLVAAHKCIEKAKLETDSAKEAFETLKSELQVAKEDVAHTQEREGIALSKIKNLNEELSMLKNEAKLATDAEEKSRTAMDDLALVLIEVKNENKEIQETLRITKEELDKAKEEADTSRKLLKPTEEKYQALLDEAKKELDQANSVAQRLKLEAEDSTLAWNQKELEFVNCIKVADEENNATKQENSKLKVSLKTAEEMAKIAREENCKLRDILKQALNETTAAKEAAEIAKEENSQLKDSLLDKDDVLQELTRENERLRIKETAGYETIKELKKLLSSASTRELKPEDMEREKMFEKQNLLIERTDSRNIKELLNLKFEEPQVPHARKNEDEDPEMAEMLKGSIFDVMDSPDAVKAVAHHRKMSSLSICDSDLNFEDIVEGTHLDDPDDKNSQRKKRALLRRFGDLLRRTSFHRRDPSVG